MSLAFFGSNGAYYGDPLNQQGAFQQQSQMQNAYANQMIGSTIGTGYGVLGGAGLYGLANATTSNVTITSQGIFQQEAQKAPEPPKEKKSYRFTAPGWLRRFKEKYGVSESDPLEGVLMKLRFEIEKWHGDILERCPA